MRLVVPLLMVATLLTTAAPAVAQDAAPSAAPDYVVGAPDVLMITVWKQLDLSGKFEAAQDGTIIYPLLGSVQVAGKRVPAIEKELTAALADGFVRAPQVTVAIDAFRSQQVFVLGEVKAPGPVPLTGGMTLIEALVRGGSFSESLGGEVIVSRLPGGAAGRPRYFPGADGAVEVQRVDLRDLRAGKMAQNIPLQNGDTVFVTRAETVFIEGQVGTPGVFVMEKGMTVLRLISLAGGATAIGAPNRARVRRIVDGKVTNERVKLTDLVEPGDTVIVHPLDLMGTEVESVTNPSRAAAMTHRWLVVGMAVVALLATAPQAARAQDLVPEPASSVKMRIGPLEAAPSVLTSNGYDTNITRVGGISPISSYEFFTHPQLDAKSRTNSFTSTVMSRPSSPSRLARSPRANDPISITLPRSIWTGPRPSCGRRFSSGGGTPMRDQTMKSV